MTLTRSFLSCSVSLSRALSLSSGQLSLVAVTHPCLVGVRISEAVDVEDENNPVVGSILERWG